MVKFSDNVLLAAVREYLATSELVGYTNTMVFLHDEMKDRVKRDLGQVIGKAIDGLFDEAEAEAEADESGE